jgi:ssDNA-binding Zn-finger/Zn-ribbon topoisomerase 1
MAPSRGNPRLELIDGLELIRWYRLTNGGKIEDKKVDTEPATTEKCPQCGGDLVIRNNHKTGEKFYGCANYPKCHFIKSLK